MSKQKLELFTKTKTRRLYMDEETTKQKRNQLKTAKNKEFNGSLDQKRNDDKVVDNMRNKIFGHLGAQNRSPSARQHARSTVRANLLRRVPSQGRRGSTSDSEVEAYEKSRKNKRWSPIRKHLYSAQRTRPSQPLRLTRTARNTDLSDSSSSDSDLEQLVIRRSFAQDKPHPKQVLKRKLKNRASSSSGSSSGSETPLKKRNIQVAIKSATKPESEESESSDDEDDMSMDSDTSSDSSAPTTKPRLYSDTLSPKIGKRISLSKPRSQSETKTSAMTVRRHSLGSSLRDRLDVSRKRESKSDFSPSQPSNGGRVRIDLFGKELKFKIHKEWESMRVDKARSVVCNQAHSEIPFVDTHCHIDFLFKRLPYNKSYDDYVEEAFIKFPDNFEGCIADWCQPSLYHQAPDVLGRSHNNCEVWGAFGCHPHFAQDYDLEVETKIKNWISGNDNVLAIGEMGLDYSDRFGQTDHDLQKKVFVKQLKLANRLDVPIVIHCRDADMDLLPIMKRYVKHDHLIHRHCLTTDEKTVRPLLDHFPNCHVGFTNLLSNKSASNARSSAAKIPLNRILLETDSPYFIPRCVSEATNSATKWSHSGMALCVAAEIAALKHQSVDDVLKQVRKNVTTVYGI